MHPLSCIYRPVITVCTTLPDFRLTPPLPRGTELRVNGFYGRFNGNLQSERSQKNLTQSVSLGIPGESGATLAARGGPEWCPLQQDVVMPYVWASIPKNPTEPPRVTC